MSIAVIILIILTIVILVSISIYNKLIAQIEAVNNNNKQIDIQLDRRFKVFESLINVVKKYMDYEQTTLKDVVKLRGQAEAAKESGNEQGRIDAENAISKIASGINVVFEQYPRYIDGNGEVQERSQVAKSFKPGAGLYLGIQYKF